MRRSNPENIEHATLSISWIASAEKRPRNDDLRNSALSKRLPHIVFLAFRMRIKDI